MPQTVELVRVKTTLGDRVYPLDTRVYTNLGGKTRYFQEHVADLRGDEMILWHREGIDKTLEEVEPYLQLSPRYQGAEQTVFATNSSGQKIPRFRAELIKALAARGVVQAETPEDLERKVMKEDGKDFTPQQYTAMTQFLYQALQRLGKEDEAPTRETETIRSWLHGTTTGPLDSKVFYSLALASGSKTFEEWFMGAKETTTSSTGFWGAYKFYTILRQSIMRKLASGKGQLREKLAEAGESNGKASGYKNSQSIDTTPETQIVLHQFMEEINEKFTLARVVGVQRLSVPADAARERRQADGARLANGAYTGKAMGGVTPVPLTQIVNESNVFSGMLSYIVEDYLKGIVSGKYNSAKALDDIIRLLKGEAVPQPLFNETGILDNYMLYARFVKALIAEVGDALGLFKSGAQPDGIPLGFLSLRLVEKKSGKNVYPEVLKALSEYLTEAVLSGEIDQQLQLSEHTFYRAFEHEAKLIRGRPETHYRAIKLQIALRDPRLSRKEMRNLEIELRKAQQKLAGRYGFSGGTKLFLLTDLLNGTFDFYVSSIKNRLISKMGWSVPQYHELLAQFVNSLHDPAFVRTNQVVARLRQRKGEREGGGNFTSAEVTSMLEQHGLTELYRFIPPANFAFDGSAPVVTHKEEPSSTQPLDFGELLRHKPKDIAELVKEAIQN